MKSLAILLSILMLFPARVANADEELQADIAIIRRAGAPAPFPGVLFSDRAFAEQKAKQEQELKKFEDLLRFELDIQALHLKLATTTTALALDAERIKNVEISKIKDERIKDLTEQLIIADEKSAPSSIGENLLWMLAGGTAVAIGGLVYAATTGAFNQ